MAWMFLIIAGLGEVLWASMLEYKKYFFYILTMGATMYFTVLANRVLPISIVYPVLIGIGTLGIIFMSILFFGEKITALKIFFIGCILLGVMGLKFLH